MQSENKSNNKGFSKNRSFGKAKSRTFNKGKSGAFDKGKRKPFDKESFFDKDKSKSFEKDNKGSYERKGSGFSKGRNNSSDKRGFGLKDSKAFGRKSFSRGDKKPFSRNDKKPEEKKETSYARLTAFRIIQDITVRGAYTALAINNVLKVNKLPENDKRLVTNIVYTTIENIIKIDYCIDRFMERPAYEPALRDVLRLSVAQILFMDKIPDFAVINESVNLIRLVSNVESWQGVVNGVLRNIVRNKDSISWPDESEDMEKYLSIMFSMPQWLVHKLIATFGEEEAKNIITYSNKDNSTCIRPNLMRIKIDEFEKLLEKKGWEYQKGIVANSYLVKHIDSISEDEDYKNGLFSVQGQSSMLAAMAVNNGLGMMVLDACAAPGGKTFYMAEKQQGSGRIFAWDIYPHRVELIRNQMYRLSPGNVRVAECDASKYRDDMFENFDRVLIDAPCSNLGVLAEKPDLLMKLNEDSFKNITELQAKILENCSKYLKVGGELVYSTCSILPEENEEQVKKFLEKNPNFSVAEFPKDYPSEILEHKKGIGISLFAHSSGLEGFYIARLIKNE